MPRDITVPWTEGEVEEAKVTFQRIPSYSDGSIPSSDISLLSKSLDIERTPEQLAAYKTYWDKNFGGRIPLVEVESILSTIHDNAKNALGRAQVFDKDGNGFISEDEFEQLMEIMIVHDPKLKNVPFKQFVLAADTNHDGLVSLKECAVWMERNM